MFIAGSMREVRTAVFQLLRERFLYFLPLSRLFHAKVHPHRWRGRDLGPQNENFMQFWNKRPIEAYPFLGDCYQTRGVGPQHECFDCPVY